MVTLAQEMEKVRELTERAARAIGISELPPLGAMIETPAAALCSDEIAAHADFLNLGTNDLTQYTMAADRENPTASHYFRDDHRAVLRLVQTACEQAGDTPISICGELAGRATLVPRLIEFGIRTLSVAPPLVPLIKQTVRGVP
jgi:phosphoenolpyruvate-protein kinase (PTS system EI component)